MLIVILTAVLQLIAGLGIFLIACTMLSSNLESLSGPSLRRLFYRTSSNKSLGVLIGTVATAIIQSSGATAIMVIGFVNAGIMSLTQATTIIYGAAIGTTVTGQIVALGLSSGSGVSTAVIFASLCGVGAFICAFAKTDALNKTGGIVSGFGMLFAGLNIMSASMKQFANLPALKNYIASVSNPVVLILIGVVITAIVQSSSVTTSVIITMLVSGLITLNQGIYLVLGSNIGTCSPALIAGFTGSYNAKRTALIQFFFKTVGVIIFSVINVVLNYTTSGAVNYGVLFERIFPNAPQLQLAMFHTLFNLIIVFLAIPVADVLVGFVTKIVKKDDVKAEHHLYHLDYNMMRTPSLASRQVKEEILNMGRLAMENFNLSLDIICSGDNSRMEEFSKREDELDWLNREIQKYVVELQKFEHGEYDRRYLATTYKSVADFERIGDYAENITEYAELLAKGNECFSDKAVSEIEHVRKLINDMSNLIFEAYFNKDIGMFRQADLIEEQVDDETNAMAESHIDRLNNGECTATAGAQYLSLAENMERVADHLINVGRTIFNLSLPQISKEQFSKLHS